MVKNEQQIYRNSIWQLQLYNEVAATRPSAGNWKSTPGDWGLYCPGIVHAGGEGPWSPELAGLSSGGERGGFSVRREAV